MALKAGNRVKVVGPTKWLEQVGVQNREGQVGVLVSEKPASLVLLDGRGATNVFHVKFMDSQPNMLHTIPGVCLKDVEDDWEESNV